MLCGRSAPFTIACAMKRERQSASSIGTGATYLPFSSLYCSFARPLYTMNGLAPAASSSLYTSSHRSPVRNQRVVVALVALGGSSTITSAVASALFQ